MKEVSTIIVEVLSSSWYRCLAELTARQIIETANKLLISCICQTTSSQQLLMLSVQSNRLELSHNTHPSASPLTH